MQIHRFLGHLERPAAMALWLFCCTVLLSACQGDPATEAGLDPLIPVVEAVQARHGTLPLTQRLSGVVEAVNRVEVYPEITAVVSEVLVADGAAVTRGQPLVRLRDTEFAQRLVQARASHSIAEAQLKGARAQAREAQAEFERTRSLAEQDLASEAELQTAEARAESAAAEVDLAEARMAQAQAAIAEQEENLTRTVIRSPIDGHVGNRDAEMGMLARPGSRLFSLGQLDSVRIEVILTDRMLAVIEEGQRADINLAGGSTTVTATASLSRISPFLHPVAHSTRAEIDLPNPDRRLKPGMFVTVDVYHGESEEATLVPLSAVYEDAATGLVGVYVARDDLAAGPISESGASRDGYLTEAVRFEFVPVQIIAEGGMEAAVRPVSPEDWVVTVGQNLLAGELARARVRQVDWSHVERLQRLQREDLMLEIIEQQARNREATP